MYYSRIKKKNQITLPAQIINALHLSIGDTLEMEINQEGCLLLRPKKLIDAADMWILEDDVQKSLKKSFDDIKKGKIVASDSADEMFEKLDKGEGL
ncbi:MAG: AbrB/MazE/SpoVT family DNA-binding domain-containing protein [Armatimonadota bacterium]